MKPRKWSRSQLEEAAKKSYSIRQVLAHLGLREAGGNYTQIRKYLDSWGIDTKHFKGKGWSLGLKNIGKPRLSLENILIAGSNFQSFKLKKRLFVAGLKNKKCEKCGWSKVSADDRLPLEIHHKNGDGHDNRLENLQILCPNCHSLEPNYRGRNIK